MQFHGIVSYPHLNLIPFDMSALQAEWCVPGSTYLICYPLGSGPGNCSSTHISPPAGTPPLASCINSMTHHARLWQLPLFRVALILLFFNLGVSKWSELTHYFLPSRTDQKQTLQGHVRMAKHIRHVHIWPCFSGTAHTAVILALWVIIWVISKDTSAILSMMRICWVWLILGKRFPANSAIFWSFGVLQGQSRLLQ